MKRLLLILTMVTAGVATEAQHYKHSAGIRTGYTSAITYKRFFSDDQAIEFMASGRNDGFQVTTIYQFNKPMEVSFNDRFFVYYGVGASVGYERFSGRFAQPELNPAGPDFVYGKRTYFTMGINAILGVEYRWLAVPITVALDVKPLIQYIGMQYTETNFWDMGLSIKYVF